MCIIAWINNIGLPKIHTNNAPTAFVAFTVFNQNNRNIGGHIFPATLVDGHYMACMYGNSQGLQPGTYKIHIVFLGNSWLEGCNTWTNITIMP
ncbi:MAG: hypothetical protein NKF70_09350 [Methanobacterium sp. ERen5]|nr:MAG: hypothetical protein NKF70_09350 [Methanobacterium sp. ERen5]